jgi:hypothetical protein
VANRFWVGGSATWDATAGTKWATTSGGAGGAATPTAADDVFLNAASGAVTVTTAASPVCRSIDCTGFTGTLSLQNATTALNIGDASGGALKFVSGMTLTLGGASCAITFVSTSNNGGAGWAVTTGGKLMPGMTFNGAGGKWVLQDATTLGAGGNNNITLTAGTLDTNNQSVTASSFLPSNSNTRTITFGSSALTLTAASALGFNALTVTGLTVTANTATVTLSGNSGNFNGGSKDWNGLSLVMSGSGTQQIQGSAGLTLANVTRTGTAVKTDSLSVANAFTVTGTFTVNGNSATNRVLVQSSPLGTARTITAAAVSFSNVDFTDITGAGAASWNLSAITGGSGDAGGNSGITFTTPTTRYGVVAGNWSSTATWSTTSGGSGGASVPLPQDDVVLNASSAVGSYNIDMARSGKNFDCTGFTRTLSCQVASAWYGSWTLGSGMNFSGTASQTLGGRGSYTITTAGQTITCSIIVSTAATSTYTMQDAFTSNRAAAGAITVASGTLTTNAQTVALGSASFSVSGGTLDATGSALSVTSASAGMAAGTGALIGGTYSLPASAASTPWSVTGATVSGVSVIFTGASGVGRTFAGGSKTYDSFTHTVADSPGAIAITGGNTFGTLNIGPGRKLTVQSTTNVLTPTLSAEARDYVYLPGALGNHISTPDAAANSITGDITIDVKVALADWTPSSSTALVSKYTSAARSFIFYVNTVGNLVLLISANGSTNVVGSSTVSPTVSGGGTLWVRASWSDSGNVVRFYTKVNDGDAWTQLGANVALASAGIFDSATEVGIGQTVDNTIGSAAFGRFYAVKLYNSDLGSGSGTPVQSFDANAQVTGQDTWTNPTTAEVWTLNGLAAQGDGRITIESSSAGTAATLSKQYTDPSSNVWSFFGTSRAVAGYLDLPGSAGSYASTPDSAALSITGDLDIIVKARLPDWTPTTTNTLVAKRASASAGVSYVFLVNIGGSLDLRLSSDGSTGTAVSSSVANAIPDNTDSWVRATWRQSDGRVQFFTGSDGVAWTQLGADRTLLVASIADTTTPVELGSQQGGAVNPLNGRIYRAIVKNGIDGTVVANPDVTYIATNAFSYLSLKDSKAIGYGTWHAGSTSTDVSGNTNWLFTDPVVVTGSQVTETEDAYAGDYSSPVVVTGSQAAETDTATNGSPTVVPSGAAVTETEAAAAGVTSITVQGSQAVETETVSVGISVLVVVGSQSTETETGTTGTVRVSLPGVLATESDVAFAGSSVVQGGDQTYAGASVAETDTANVGVPRLVVVGSQVTEVVSASSGSAVLVRSGTSVTESTTSSGGQLRVAILGSAAIGSETTSVGSAVVHVGGHQITETSSALTGAIVFRLLGNATSETSSAVSGVAAVTVGGATRTETSVGSHGTPFVLFAGTQLTEADSGISGDLLLALHGTQTTEISGTSFGTVQVVWSGADSTELDIANDGRLIGVLRIRSRVSGSEASQNATGNEPSRSVSGSRVSQNASGSRPSVTGSGSEPATSASGAVNAT